MKHILLLLTLMGTALMSAQTLTVQNLRDTSWRELRDMCRQVRTVDLSRASSALVPDNAMHSRHHLQRVLLPQDIAEIGTQAFFACDSLEEICIPASVKRVGQSAFSQCRHLRRVTFEGAPQVDDYAFTGCPELKDIVVKGGRPKFSTLAFYGTRSVYEEDLLELDTLSTLPALIPQPAQMTVLDVEPLMWELVRGVQAPRQLQFESRYLQQLLTENTNYGLEYKADAHFWVKLSVDNTLPDPEAYVLHVDEGGITLSGGSPAGVFWGIMTLRQLILDSNGSAYRRHSLNAVHIEDQPRMHNRQVVLDTNRTFVTFEELKRIVPLIAQYKYNALHLRWSDEKQMKELVKYAHLYHVAVTPINKDDMPEINWGMSALTLLDAYAQDPAWNHDEEIEREVVSYQLFPRALALSEAGWSPQSKLNYEDFLRRLHPHMMDLQRRGVSVNLRK